MVPYKEIDINAPVATAFEQVGFASAQFIVTVELSRVSPRCCCDDDGATSNLPGHGPRWIDALQLFRGCSPHLQDSLQSHHLDRLLVASAASLLPLSILADLTNIGTLFAFALVCTSVLILRYVDPHRERPFRCPFSPVFPGLGIILCVALMLSLPSENWLRLVLCCASA